MYGVVCGVELERLVQIATTYRSFQSRWMRQTSFITGVSKPRSGLLDIDVRVGRAGNASEAKGGSTRKIKVTTTSSSTVILVKNGTWDRG